MSKYRKTKVILASLILLTSFTVGYELHSETIHGEENNTEQEHNHQHEHNEEEHQHQEPQDHQESNQNNQEETQLFSVSDAVEESSLSIFVILFNFLIAITSLYFIAKILIDVWRGTIKQ